MFRVATVRLEMSSIPSMTWMAWSNNMMINRYLIGRFTRRIISKTPIDRPDFITCTRIKRNRWSQTRFQPESTFKKASRRLRALSIPRQILFIKCKWVNNSTVSKLYRTLIAPTTLIHSKAHAIDNRSKDHR